VNSADSKYDRLFLSTAWRGHEISRGASSGDLERRLRELEQRAADLNLERETVHLAVELAALEPALDDDARFALIVLIVITMAALAQGSTRFPVAGDASREPMEQMLAALAGSGRDRLRASIAALLANNLAPRIIGRQPSDRLPLLFLDPFIAHQRSLRLERRLVDSIVALSAGERGLKPSDVRGAIDDVIARPSMQENRRVELSHEQRRAIETAATGRFAIISGGPGTGKTSIVVAIVRVMARLGIAPGEIALSAPTGRAAFRMRESVAQALARIAEPSPEDDALRAAGLDAATVHRLLGYSPERRTFMHHRGNPLAARVVIVDEGSMLDLALMERLAGALSADAQLVLLGDADQLPSVAAGAVFRDLAPSDRNHPLFKFGVRLTRNYRTRAESPAGSAIVEVCRRINAGETDLSEAIAMRANAEAVEFGGVEMTSGLDGFLDRWEREQVAGDGEIAATVEREFSLEGGTMSADEGPALARLFEHRARARLLCVTRVGAAGSDAINARMHRRALRGAKTLMRSHPFVPGEPVIVLRNDYERELFNGDLGVIVNARDADGRRFLAAVFNRGDTFAAFRLETMRDLIEHAYATTVHKAQGSEFDLTALILPDRDLPLLTRELLYTAISRCRRAATIVGDPQFFTAGVARKLERYSGVADALSARLAPPAARQLGFDF